MYIVCSFALHACTVDAPCARLQNFLQRQLSSNLVIVFLDSRHQLKGYMYIV